MKNRIKSMLRCAFQVTGILMTGGILLNSASATDFEIRPFEPDLQGNAPWCWASATQMVLTSLGQKEDVCEIVSKIKGKNCCGIFTPNGCWDGGNPVDALRAYGVSYRYEATGSTQQSGTSVRELEKVIRAVRNNKMPILHLKQPDDLGPSHVAVVKAVRQVENLGTVTLELFDPAIGQQRVPVRFLLNGFYNPSGQQRYWWAGTYLPN